MDSFGVVRKALGLLSLANRLAQDRRRPMRVSLRDGARLPECIQVGVLPHKATDQRVLVVCINVAFQKVGHEARARRKNTRVVGCVLFHLRQADCLGGTRRARDRIGKPLACVAQLGIGVNS